MNSEEINTIRKYTAKIIHNRLQSTSTKAGSFTARTGHTSDIVQDLLVKISKGIKGWHELDLVEQKKIVASAARYSVIDFIRKQSRTRTVLSNCSTLISEAADERSDGKLSFESIDHLKKFFSENDLEVFVLIVAGFSFVEVSNIVHNPVSRIRKIVKRARETLEEHDILVI